jgi:hypothetical protein
MSYTKIKTIKHINTGEPFAPRTHIKAILDDDGNSLESLLNYQNEQISESLYGLNNKYIYIGESNYTQVSKKFGRVTSGETYRVYIHNTNLEYTEKDEDADEDTETATEEDEDSLT